MRSEPIESRLHAFVDDELDLSSRLAVEALVAESPVVRAQVEHLRALRAAVREGASYHDVPADLHAMLWGIARSSSPASPPTPARPKARPEGARFAWFAWRPAMGALAAALVAAVALPFVLSGTGRGDAIADEVVASHVRSTLGGHLLDVASSDHHVVKPWLSSRLDFSPPVGDAKLGDATFVGGRVDYLDRRPVAALVYRDGTHVAQVFVWPDGAADRGVRIHDVRGFRVADWTRGGMQYWVVSDVGGAAFGAFVDALRTVDPPS